MERKLEIKTEESVTCYAFSLHKKGNGDIVVRCNDDDVAYFQPDGTAKIFPYKSWAPSAEGKWI